MADEQSHFSSGVLAGFFKSISKSLRAALTSLGSEFMATDSGSIFARAGAGGIRGFIMFCCDLKKSKSKIIIRFKYLTALVVLTNAHFSVALDCPLAALLQVPIELLDLSLLEWPVSGRCSGCLESLVPFARPRLSHIPLCTRFVLVS